MFASRVVRLIETHSDQLAHSLVERLLHDEKLAEIRRVPREEILIRAYEIYNEFSDWLLTKTEADVEKMYTAVGARRAHQGVAFSTVAAALMLTKEHLFDFVKHEVSAERPLELYQEMELLDIAGQFFDRALFHAARGYERAMASEAAAAERRILASSLR